MPSESYQIVTGIIVAVIVLFIAVGFIFILVTYSNRRKKIHFKEKELLQSQFSQTLLQSQLEIKEETLSHISRELHDNLGHTASIIKINLHTLKLEEPGKTLQKIEDTKELVRQLITDMKSLTLSLNSDRIGQLGIIRGLEEEADKIARTGAYTMEFKHTGPNPAIDQNTTTILFRMAQEILNNAIKHSQATHIHILSETSENLFTLAISDNGAGFDGDEKMKSGGSGLLNLKNRARLINASFTLQSSPGNGTTVNIELPL